MDRGKVVQILKWLPFVIVPLNILLLIAGIIDAAKAAIIIVSLELALVVIVIAELTAVRRALREARGSGATWAQAMSQALDAAFPKVIAFMIRQELAVFYALLELATNRKDILAVDRVPISYSRAVSKVVWIIASIGMVVALVPSIFATPVWLKWLLIGSGCYTVLYAAGYRAMMSRNPHLVDSEELLLRSGTLRSFTIPTSTVSHICPDEQGATRKTGKISDEELIVAVFGKTNLVIDLDYAIEVEASGERLPVRRVRFLCDQPKIAVKILQKAMASSRLRISDAGLEETRP